jgi:alkylated DNA repair protein alkB family protein 6
MDPGSPQLVAMPACLEEARIKSLPSSAFYIPDFISQEEEQVLLNKVFNTSCRRFTVIDSFRSKRHQSLDGNNFQSDACRLTQAISPEIPSSTVPFQNG